MVEGRVGVEGGDEGKLCTFHSRDGGYSWKEMVEGTTVHAVGNRGGIIVMAHNERLTNKLLYSLDGGNTLNVLAFTTEPLFVHSISSLQSSSKFLITASREIEGKLYIGVDFSLLLLAFISFSFFGNQKN